MGTVIILDEYFKKKYKPREKYISDNLKRLRHQKRQSIQFVARHLGYSCQQITDYEEGYQIPSDRTLIVLATFFRQPVHYFYLSREEHRLIDRLLPPQSGCL